MSFETIDAKTLKEWLDEGKDFVLVDVLSRESYDAKHLPRAQHADVHKDGFMEKVTALVGDKGKTVVVYCASKSCQASPKAADELAQAGYSDVYDFEGGLADWQNAGYSFEEDK